MQILKLRVYFLLSFVFLFIYFIDFDSHKVLVQGEEYESPDLVASSQMDVRRSKEISLINTNLAHQTVDRY